MAQATPQNLTAQERILDALLRAHGVLADYVEYGPRNCQRTIDRLFSILDDQDLIAAVNAINLESLSSTMSGARLGGSPQRPDTNRHS